MSDQTIIVVQRSLGDKLQSLAISVIAGTLVGVVIIPILRGDGRTDRPESAETREADEGPATMRIDVEDPPATAIAETAAPAPRAVTATGPAEPDTTQPVPARVVPRPEPRVTSYTGRDYEVSLDGCERAAARLRCTFAFSASGTTPTLVRLERNDTHLVDDWGGAGRLVHIAMDGGGQGPVRSLEPGDAAWMELEFELTDGFDERAMSVRFTPAAFDSAVIIR